MATPAAEPTDAAEAQLLNPVQASRLGALGTFYNRLKDNASASFQEAKPWAELVDRTSFARPASSAEAVSRLRWNATYFRVNYTIVAVGTSSLVLVFHPWSLVVLAGLAGLWFYAYVIRTTPLSFNGRQLSDREKLLALSVLSLVVVFLLTSVGTTLFYALGISTLLIAAHAALKVPDDLFLDAPPETAPGGLFALFTGAGRAAQVAPTVVTVV